MGYFSEKKLKHSKLSPLFMFPFLRKAAEKSRETESRETESRKELLKDFSQPS